MNYDGSGSRSARSSSLPSQGSRSAKVEAALRHQYARYQYRFVQFFCEHLADVSKNFSGDLHQVLILSIVGQSALNERRNDLNVLETPFGPCASVSASRIADVCGIPRQTVRRKLAALQKRGWVEQTDDQRWRLQCRDGVATARIDLAALDSRLLTRVARLFVELEDIVTRQPKSGIPPSGDVAASEPIGGAMDQLGHPR